MDKVIFISLIIEKHRSKSGSLRRPAYFLIQRKVKQNDSFVFSIFSSAPAQSAASQQTLLSLSQPFI